VKRFFIAILACLVVCGCRLTNASDHSRRNQSPHPAIQADDALTSPLHFVPHDYPVRVVSVEADEAFTNIFRPRKKGWLGSDAAHSIPLSDTNILWLFGDTLVGEMRDGTRVREGFEFIHNGIGIQDISSGVPGDITFYWQTSDGKSSDFFPSVVSTHYVTNLKWAFEWSTMGMILDSHLFVYTYRIEAGEEGEFSMPTTLIRVPNPLAPPEQWKTKSYDLGIGNAHQGFHSAIHVKEPYVYFLGYDDLTTHPLVRRAVLARAKTKDLLEGGLSEVYEFWTKDKTGAAWKPHPENLVSLFYPGNTETGIHYISEWGLYVTFAYEPNSPDIFLTVASELTGPWSVPVSIYKVPEHDGSIPIISYAVRPHPEFSTKPGELVVSYATNSKTWGTQPLFSREGAEIYFPRIIRVQLALNEEYKDP